jgi:hypothetical protein
LPTAGKLAPATGSKTVVLGGANLVLLEMRIDGFLVSDSITAYQAAERLYLPLGEVARALTIAIQVDPVRKTAKGFVRREDTNFSLNVNTATLETGGERSVLDLSAILLQDDDVYVELRTLAKWLKVDFEINMNNLVVDVKAVEPLPIQLRLKREQVLQALAARGQQADRPDLPRLKMAYKLADVPFIDQTIALGARRGNGVSVNSAAYTTYMKGDIAGMQGALFLSGSNEANSSQSRFTLGRTDPDAGLLGPLRARNFAVGNVPVAGILNLTRTNDSGRGVTFNNMPLDRPTRFNAHSVRGDLPPGWDVELFFNDALVAYQQSRADGKYSFEDLALIYGANEFRLVFHGPQGQLRVEKQTFLLDDSISVPGDFVYNVASSNDNQGLRHSVALAEYGLSKSLTVAGSVINDQRTDGTIARYHSLGLRGFAGPAMFTGNLTRQGEGGLLSDFGFKTRLGKTAIGYNRLLATRNFSSEYFQAGADPVRTRDRLRVDGMLPGGPVGILPYSFQLQRDTTESGSNRSDATALVSASVNSISLSNQLHLGTAPGYRIFDGTFSSGSSIGNFRLRGQINYLIHPERRISAIAISGDRNLSNGYLINVGAARSFTSPELRMTVALNKSLGNYGLAVTGGYSSYGEYSVGLVLFMGMGRDPRTGKWATSAMPLAESGAASAMVYLDRNGNGAFDKGDERLKGVGFMVNGSPLPVRTGDNGLAFVERLSPYRNTDVSINRGTLEDPQMSPLGKGFRLLPRPGNVATLDFPVVYAGELDGNVYLVTDGRRRGTSNVQLELLDARQNIVAKARSENSGYYHFGEVPPGQYQLRIAPTQLRELKLKASGPLALTVNPSGDPTPPGDFELRRIDQD